MRSSHRRYQQRTEPGAFVLTILASRTLLAQEASQSLQVECLPINAGPLPNPHLLAEIEIPNVPLTGLSKNTPDLVYAASRLTIQVEHARAHPFEPVMEVAM